MISSASGYEWVNVTSLSGFITGDIMPVRDNRGDGSWQRLKYEDLLFLFEAQLERANWELAAPSALVTPPGRGLRRTVTLNQGIWPASGGAWVLDYLDREAAMPTELVSTTASASIPAACGIGAAPFAARPADGNPRKLAADELRTMFYNVKLATRTVVPVSFGQITDSWTVESTTTYREGGGSVTTSVVQGRLWAWYGTGRYGSFMDLPAFASKATLATYMHCTAATLLVKTATESEQTGTVFYDILSLPCSVTNGAVGVPSLGGIAAQTAAAHGINYSTSPAYKASTDGGIVDVQSMALVVDHTFPAEINSLNWSWTPQSSQQGS